MDIKPENQGSEIVLELIAVYQRYLHPKTKQFQTVLNDINLKIPKGQFVAIVGPSGSGKTRLLNVIGGFEQAHEGHILVGGKPCGPPNRDRGIVTQHYSLFPHLTVLENIAFGLELETVNFIEKWMRPFHFQRLYRKHKEEASAYLHKVKLAEHADKYPHQLSGGMRQRVAIAQALIMNPLILLMDEPFGALDPGTRKDLQSVMIETQHREKNTVFFVTHDLEEAVLVADRILVISPHYYAEDSIREGSKIVLDLPLPAYESLEAKRNANFQSIYEQIIRTGFNRDFQKA